MGTTLAVLADEFSMRLSRRWSFQSLWSRVVKMSGM